MVKMLPFTNFQDTDGILYTRCQIIILKTHSTEKNIYNIISNQLGFWNCDQMPKYLAIG